MQYEYKTGLRNSCNDYVTRRNHLIPQELCKNIPNRLQLKPKSKLCIIDYSNKSILVMSFDVSISIKVYLYEAENAKLRDRKH